MITDLYFSIVPTATTPPLKKTTIQVSQEVYKQLKERGKKGQTFSEIIEELLQ